VEKRKGLGKKKSQIAIPNIIVSQLDYKFSKSFPSPALVQIVRNFLNKTPEILLVGLSYPEKETVSRLKDATQLYRPIFLSFYSLSIVLLRQYRLILCLILVSLYFQSIVIMNLNRLSVHCYQCWNNNNIFEDNLHNDNHHSENNATIRILRHNKRLYRLQVTVSLMLR